MSTDITGWVEIKKYENWFGVIKINTLIRKNHSMIEFLFGARSEDYKNALAGRRLPQEKSREAQDHGIWETWIGLDELLAVDWEKHEDVNFTDDWKRLVEMMKLVQQGENVMEVRIICTFF